MSKTTIANIIGSFSFQKLVLVIVLSDYFPFTTLDIGREAFIFDKMGCAIFFSGFTFHKSFQVEVFTSSVSVLLAVRRFSFSA